MMLRDVDRQIRRVFARHGVKGVKPHGDTKIITGMARYSKAARTAAYWYFRDIGQRVTDGTSGSYGAQAYDNFNIAASELARVIMLVVDRGQQSLSMEKLFSFLSELETSGRFKHEDYERLIMR